MNKLIKYIGIAGIFSSAILGSTLVTTTKDTHAIVSIYNDSDEDTQDLEDMTFEILFKQLNSQLTDGSTLTQGEKAVEALPLLWKTFTNIREAAIEKTKEIKIPFIVEKIVKLINNVNSTQLKLANEKTILKAENNTLIMELQIGRTKYNLNMTLINVKPIPIIVK